ncbi:AraC family transcriptional regulator [Pullulanibacillus camelliae]|uniref:AraC family transcriptional regulator n=1 Tax=Pullulanibacillus camelliae TaxID=1707096 RepID=A0A8J2VN23_9BACL|nr:AraC family transcriptional regulator [Pullulanibacillus camelliae]GGE32857.1 AraC family transcriptional regulator [Pullulanibacillus camelliae]
MFNKRQSEHYRTSVDPNDSLHQKLLDQLITLVNQFTDKEGQTQTSIPFLSIFKHSNPGPLAPGVTTPSFCLILQGSKKLLIGQDILHYHTGNYLASIIDLPATGQVTRATPDSPYIGLRIDCPIQEIASVMIEAQLSAPSKDTKQTRAAFIGSANADLLDHFIRLMKLLNKPEQVPFLSNLIKREMLYVLLTGEYGQCFLQHAFFDPQADGIGKAIAWIKDNLAQSFTVEELAKLCNMSVSGLHHKFKALTTMGPIQYQKKLRLQEARRLMLGEYVDAGTAAHAVGYESPSQFNREYHRHFGLPPLKDIKALRKSSGLSGPDID